MLLPDTVSAIPPSLQKKLMKWILCSTNYIHLAMVQWLQLSPESIFIRFSMHFIVLVTSPMMIQYNRSLLATFIYTTFIHKHTQLFSFSWNYFWILFFKLSCEASRNRFGLVCELWQIESFIWNRYLKTHSVEKMAIGQANKQK